MSKIKEMWERLQEQLAEQRKVQKTLDELSRLSDKELRDLGISRSDIWSLATGAYRG